jgi:hypothetical protein
VVPYHCGKHGADCPANCATLRKWWATVEKTLPETATGRSKAEGSPKRQRPDKS